MTISSFNWNSDERYSAVAVGKNRSDFQILSDEPECIKQKVLAMQFAAWS